MRAYAGFSDITFQRITINEGLSLSSVYCIYQDSKGFMWFATEDGLNKYDGRLFTIYNHTPGVPNSLSYKWVEHIVEDPAGNLWLGTRRGLTRLDPTTDNITQYLKGEGQPGSIINDTVISLAINGDDLWVGTMRGLSKINTRTMKIETVELECNLAYQTINTIYVDDDSRTWVGTNAGLFLHQAGKEEMFWIVPSFPGGERIEVHSVMLTQDTLWVGTGKSLMRFDISETGEADVSYPLEVIETGSPVETLFRDSGGRIWVFSSAGLFTYSSGELQELITTPHASPSLAINPLKPIIEDREGNIWTGTFGDGTYMIKSGTSQVIHYMHDPADPVSLSDNTINSLYEDRAGGVWIGTFGAGISLYDPNSNLINTLRHSAFNERSLSSSFIWSIQETRDNKVWIGTNASGIDIYDPQIETFVNLFHDPAVPGSLPQGAIREIFETSKGDIYVGTDGGGLSRYIPGKKKFLSYMSDPQDSTTISSNSVRTIYEDTTGTLWIGTREGLNSFEPGTSTFRRYLNDPGDPESLSENFVYSAIYMDKWGNLWVGTYGGGLNRMDPETGKCIRYLFDADDPSSISDNIVFSIHEDEKGYFWIGTNSGLNLFNPSTGKFKRYGMESGLPNEVIYGIMPDNNNNLWITTNKGISRLDMTEFRFKNLDVRDGLQSNEFNGGAFHKGKSGLIYAGGVYGLSIIDPVKIQPVKNEAELIISRLEILGKDVRIYQEGMQEGNTGPQDELVEIVENYYLPRHVTYLSEVRLNYRQRFFSIEFAALNNHIPEKLSYRYRMQNLEEHWNLAGNRNYVTYANMRPGTYLFQVDASNPDGFLTGKPAQLKIIISPPFWRSYWFILLMSLVVLLVIIFIYRFLLNQRTNKLLTEQNEQIRTANQQLQVSENNLKELNATKDKFFSIISHDLKNPFASVLSISELLNENFEQADREEIRQGIRKIHGTNEHIYALLENLLTWSKMQRGTISVEKVRFNMTKIIETNVNLFRMPAEKKGVKIINTTPDDIYAEGDREMISTVFRNLLNNAIKFTPAGKAINVSLETNKKMMRISVVDQGIGISNENLEKLFRIDQKFKTEGTEGEKGTGLGLIICKEFVSNNGGEISVSSTPGKGSNFSFTVPMGNGQ